MKNGEGTVHDTDRGPRRAAVFPEEANFGTRGKGRYRTPPLSGPGGKSKSLSSLFLSPFLPLKAPALAFVHSLQSQAVCSSKQYSFSNSPILFGVTKRRGNTRADRLRSQSSGSCTTQVDPPDSTESSSWSYVWHN